MTDFTPFGGVFSHMQFFLPKIYDAKWEKKFPFYSIKAFFEQTFQFTDKTLWIERNLLLITDSYNCHYDTINDKSNGHTNLTKLNSIVDFDSILTRRYWNNLLMLNYLMYPTDAIIHVLVLVNIHDIQDKISIQW